MKFTKQQTFDKVVKHLRKQRKKAKCSSKFLKGTCAYRTKSGLTCAAGCLIPNELYDKEFEGQGVGSESLSILFENLGHDIDLVSDLQIVHDHHSVKKWEERFKLVAEKHQLRYRKPTKKVVK